MHRFLGTVLAVMAVAAIGCGRQSPAPVKGTANAPKAVTPASAGAAAPAGATSGALAITADDVESVLGVQGIQVVPRLSKPGAGGDLNFALPNGDLVLMVTVSPADMAQFSRSRERYRAKDVAGVGDEAFYGPPGGTQYLLAFRKGAHVVSINTFFVTDGAHAGEPMMNEAQLTRVAQLIASRMSATW